MFRILPLLLMAGAAFVTPLSARAADKPNIVFVLFDDLGYGQPRSYNADSSLNTPHIDALARNGMRFTDAHSASAVCTPTRYGALTGRYPWRIGQYGVLTTYSPPIIPSTRLTIASFLKGHGYSTACIGKWHLGMRWKGRPGAEGRLPLGAKLTGGPNAVGFDYFCGFTHARNIGAIIEQDRVVAQVAPVENQPLMLEKALKWLSQRKPDEPFFLYFPMCPPHTPVVPSAEFAGQGGKDLVGKDPKYGDWVAQGDAMLGKLLAALDEHGLADNTLVIATSDNGAEGRAYAPLRGSKRSIYEGGHRVPFIARWPGKIKPGAVCHDVICLNDLLATVADILDTQLPEGAGEDSVSFLPALLSQTAQPVREATVHQSMAGDLAIRQGNWKAIFHKNGRRELFNLRDDLTETRDQQADQRDVAARLAKLMQSYIDRGRSTAGARQQNEAAVTLERSAKKPRKSGAKQGT